MARLVLLKYTAHLRCRIVKTIHPCIVLTVSFGYCRNITSDVTSGIHAATENAQRIPDTSPLYFD